MEYVETDSDAYPVAALVISLTLFVVAANEDTVLRRATLHWRSPTCLKCNLLAIALAIPPAGAAPAAVVVVPAAAGAAPAPKILDNIPPAAPPAAGAAVPAPVSAAAAGAAVAAPAPVDAADDAVSALPLPQSETTCSPAVIVSFKLDWAVCTFDVTVGSVLQ